MWGSWRDISGLSQIREFSSSLSAQVTAIGKEVLAEVKAEAMQSQPNEADPNPAAPDSSLSAADFSHLKFEFLELQSDYQAIKTQNEQLKRLLKEKTEADQPQAVDDPRPLEVASNAASASDVDLLRASNSELMIKLADESQSVHSLSERYAALEVAHASLLSEFGALQSVYSSSSASHSAMVNQLEAQIESLAKAKQSEKAELENRRAENEKRAARELESARLRIAELESDLDRLKVEPQSPASASSASVVDSVSDYRVQIADLESELAAARSQINDGKLAMASVMARDQLRSQELESLSATVERLEQAIHSLTAQRDELLALSHHVNRVMENFVHHVMSEDEQSSEEKPNEAEQEPEISVMQPQAPSDSPSHSHSRSSSSSALLDSAYLHRLAAGEFSSTDADQRRRIESYGLRLQEAFKSKLAALEESEKRRRAVEAELNAIKSESLNASQLNVSASAPFPKEKYERVIKAMQLKLKAQQSQLEADSAELAALRQLKAEMVEWKAKAAEKMTRLKGEKENEKKKAGEKAEEMAAMREQFEEQLKQMQAAIKQLERNGFEAQAEGKQETDLTIKRKLEETEEKWRLVIESSEKEWNSRLKQAENALENEKVEFLDEKSRLLKDFEAAKANIERLQAALLESQRDIAELRSRNSELERERAEIERSAELGMRNAGEEISRLETKQEELQGQIKEKSRQISELTSAALEKERKLRELAEEKDRLINGRKEARGKEELINQLIKDKEEAIIKVQRSEEEITEIKAELADVKEAMKQLNAEYGAAKQDQQQAETLRAELALAQSELNQLKSSQSAAESSRNSMIHELERQIEALSEAKQREKTLFEAKFNEIQSEYTQFRLQSADRERQLQSQYDLARNDLLALREKELEVHSSSQSIMDQLRQAEKRVDTLQSVQRQLTERIEQLNAENEANQSEKERAERLLEERALEWRRGTAEMEELKNLAEKLRNEIRDKEETIDKMRAHAREVAETMKSRVEEEGRASRAESERQQQIDLLTERSAILEQEKRLAESQYQSLQAVLEQIQVEFDAEKRQLQSELHRIKAEQTEHEQAQNTAIQTIRSASETEIGSLQSRLSACLTQLEALETENQALKSAAQRVKSFGMEDNSHSIDRRLVVSMLVAYFERKDKEDVLMIMFRILQFTEQERDRVNRARSSAFPLNSVKKWLNPFDNTSNGEFMPPEKLENANIADLWVEFLMKESQVAESKELILPAALPAAPVSQTPAPVRSKYPHFSSSGMEAANGSGPAASQTPAPSSSANYYYAAPPNMKPIRMDDIQHGQSQEQIQQPQSEAVQPQVSVPALDVQPSVNLES